MQQQSKGSLWWFAGPARPPCCGSCMFGPTWHFQNCPFSQNDPKHVSKNISGTAWGSGVEICWNVSAFNFFYLFLTWFWAAETRPLSRSMIRCSWRSRFENFAEHRMHECGECGVCHGETHTWKTLQEFVRKGEIHRCTVEKFSRCNMFLAGSTLQITAEKPDKTW